MAFNRQPNLPDPSEHPEAWLTKKDAAAFLGVKPEEVRRMVDRGELPSTPVGGNVSVLRSAVEAAAAIAASDPLTRRPDEDVTSMVERLSGTKLKSLPLLLSPDTTADVMGIPVSTVRTMLNAGELPYRMVGRVKRVPLPALILWLSDVA